MDKSLINLRQSTDNDRNYLINTWLRSYREHSTWGFIHKMPEKQYNIRYRQVILSILALPHVRVDIMTPADDPELILGYAVTEPATLHYCHIKKAYQRLGLSKLLIGHLLDGRTVKYSHITTPFQKAYKIDSLPWEYCPYLILGNSNLGDNEKG